MSALTREQIEHIRSTWSGHEQGLSLAEHEALCDLALRGLPGDDVSASYMGARELADKLASHPSVLIDNDVDESMFLTPTEHQMIVEALLKNAAPQGNAAPGSDFRTPEAPQPPKGGSSMREGSSGQAGYPAVAARVAQIICVPTGRYYHVIEPGHTRCRDCGLDCEVAQKSVGGGK